MIPCTFSLARLLVFVTLVGFVCGAVANLPHIDFWGIFIALLVPAIALTLLLSSFSRHRGLLIFNGFVGSTFGFTVLPFFATPLGDGFCGCVDSGTNFSVFIPPLIGALLFGGVFLLVEKLDSRSQPKNPAAP
jgi:hypothetical protein